MRLAAFLFALLLPVSAFAAETSKPPMSQNALTPDGNGYVFVPSTGPEGGGRWSRVTPHPAAQVDTTVEPVTPPPQNNTAAGGNPFADPQYTQQSAAPAQVSEPPPAEETADAPEVSAPRTPSARAYRDPNPPVESTGGGNWSLPQQDLDAMANRPSQGGAPQVQQQQQAPQQAQLPTMQSMSVTSIDKCLDQLSPAEALEVRTRYVRPYEECRNRVGANARKQKTVEAGKQAEALTPETPRNYVRVAVPKEAPVVKDTSTAASEGSEGKSYIDITGNSKAKLNP
ncbi:MAG: hypothetical protein ACAH80_04630 [Alphaproteobacteria bacterium]